MTPVTRVLAIVLVPLVVLVALVVAIHWRQPAAGTGLPVGGNQPIIVNPSASAIPSPVQSSLATSNPTLSCVDANGNTTPCPTP